MQNRGRSPDTFSTPENSQNEACASADRTNDNWPIVGGQIIQQSFHQRNRSGGYQTMTTTTTNFNLMGAANFQSPQG